MSYSRGLTLQNTLNDLGDTDVGPDSNLSKAVEAIMRSGG